MAGRSLLVAGLTFLSLGSACVHAPVNAQKKYAAAPRITNPLQGNAEQLPGLTSEGEAFLYHSFNGQELCFQASNTQSPAEVTGTRYALRFLNTDEVDLQKAPGLKTSVAKVLNSSSQLVPVTRTVQDTVRDANGNTVATVSRQVQEMETHYETQMRLCFPGATQALSASARYMVLTRESDQTRVWGIPMRPRSAWVWRFPAADEPMPITTAAAH